MGKRPIVAHEALGIGEARVGTSLGIRQVQGRECQNGMQKESILSWHDTALEKIDVDAPAKLQHLVSLGKEVQEALFQQGRNRVVGEMLSIRARFIAMAMAAVALMLMPMRFLSRRNRGRAPRLVLVKGGISSKDESVVAWSEPIWPVTGLTPARANITARPGTIASNFAVPADANMTLLVSVIRVLGTAGGKHR